jgi:hypothetical protein
MNSYFEKSIAIALESVKLCRYSYTNWFQHQCVVFKSDNLIAFIYEKHDKIYMIFRGTDDIKDLYMLLFCDLNKNKKLLKFCKEVAEYCNHKNKYIVSTGHSFGGVLAQKAAEFVSNKTRLIIFGCPLFFKLNYIRKKDVWVNKKDIIALYGTKCLNNQKTYQLYFLDNTKTLLINQHSIKSYEKFLKKLHGFFTKNLNSK